MRTKAGDLLIVFLMLAAVIYALGVIGYAFIPGALTLTDNPTTGYSCLTLIDCWLTLLAAMPSRYALLFCHYITWSLSMG